MLTIRRVFIADVLTLLTCMKIYTGDVLNIFWQISSCKNVFLADLYFLKLMIIKHVQDLVWKLCLNWFRRRNQLYHPTNCQYILFTAMQSLVQTTWFSQYCTLSFKWQEGPSHLLTDRDESSLIKALSTKINSVNDKWKEKSVVDVNKSSYHEL